jgi:hypothetical protein
MKRIVKLTESDLTRIVKRVIIEQNEIMLSEQWGQIAKKSLGMAAKSEDEIATLLKTTETTLLKSMDEIVGTALKSKSISQIDDIQKKLMHFYKKGTPEIALAGIFKVNIKVIKERLLKLSK